MFGNIWGKEGVENFEQREGRGKRKEIQIKREGELTVRKSGPILGGFLLLAGSQNACSTVSGSRHELHGWLPVYILHVFHAYSGDTRIKPALYAVRQSA